MENKKKLLAVLLTAFIVFSGCSFLKETGKVILGTSTKAMEEARSDAIKKTYDCDFDSCYEAVINLSRSMQNAAPGNEKDTFDVFSKNPIKGYIVVMGITGNIDTTEVGIFFVEIGRKTIRIEVSSASVSAKEKVARIVFDELDKLFTVAE